MFNLIPRPFGLKSLIESCLIFPNFFRLTNTNGRSGADEFHFCVVLFFCFFFGWSGADGDLDEALVAAITRVEKLLLLLSLSILGCKLSV